MEGETGVASARATVHRIVFAVARVVRLVVARVRVGHAHDDRGDVVLERVSVASLSRREGATERRRARDCGRARARDDDAVVAGWGY